MDKRFYTFREGACPKINVKTSLEFELTYYEVRLPSG